MISPKIFYETLLKHNVKFFTGVPDSLLKYFCQYLSANVDNERHVIAVNEGAAVALAIGKYLASNCIPLVYMQNSGLGNATNPLVSLASSKVYSIPLLLLIGWRGEPGFTDEPQHDLQGKITLELLDDMNIPYHILKPEEQNIDGLLKEILASTLNQSIPHALIVRRNTFSKVATNLTGPGSYSLTREEAIKVLVDNIEDNSAIVSTTGMASRELYEYCKAKNLNENCFLCVGGMGHASQIALGIALEQPERLVYCLDGDGAILMHLGGLATIARKAKNNYQHILINNGLHQSVGEQPTLALDICLPDIACSLGYDYVATAYKKEDIISHIKVMKNRKAFLEIKVNHLYRSDLSRPDTSPINNKERFMEFIRQ